MELLTVLPIFIAGLGCGYYLRDRIHNNRRARHSAPNRDRKAGILMSFKTTSMGDVWRALRKLPPIR
jgi:hypothetical protein